MKMQIVTSYGDFGEFLKTPRVYSVPAYQRPYSWKDAVLKELFEDICQVYEAAVVRGERIDHFIGSFVIGEAPSTAMGYPAAPVIDGQQRLITLTLLLAAVRDALASDVEAETIHKQFLTVEQTDSARDLKVKPGPQDLAPYESIVLRRESPAKKNKDRISLTYRYFRDRLVEEFQLPDGTSEPFKSGTLLDVIATHLKVVSIAGVAEEHAYQIFETLNHTGQELRQVDLARNALFLHLPEKATTVYQDLWAPLEEAMPKALEAYLHTWVIRRGHNVSRKATYERFLKELKRGVPTPENVEAVLRGLKDDAWSYLLLTMPSDEAVREKFGQNHQEVTPKIVAGLQRLRDWGSVPMEPLLLDVLVRWQSGGLDADAVGRMLDVLESFLVRRFVAGTPPNDLRSSFAQTVLHLKAVTNIDYESALISDLKADRKRWADDSVTQLNFMTRALYREGKAQECFFILKRIAESLEGKECPEIVLGRSSNEFSIEHVLPQDLTAAWRADLATWGDSDPDETHKLVLHTVGNLTLTAYNSELSNKRFSEKRAFIDDKLRLKLSRQILDSDQWTRAQIEKRSETLGALALQIWPRPE